MVELYRITDESLRWLIANNRYDDAVKIIHKAAAMNKVSPEKALKLLNQEELQPLHPSKNIDELCDAKGIVDNQKVPSHAAKLTMLHIFKHRRPTCTLFIVWFLWFTNALTYLGIFLTSSSLAGSTYLNFFLNALVEAPSAIFYWFFLDRIGRKKTGIFFHGIAAFGLIIATVLRLYDDDGTITTLATVFSLIGKFGISGSFNVIWNCTPEYFPTNIRNAAFGSANALCRIAGMLAPFSNLLTSQVAWAPGAIFGGCCLVATGLIFFLPETMGKELPQTMEDMEKLYD